MRRHEYPCLCLSHEVFRSSVRERVTLPVAMGDAKHFVFPMRSGEGLGFCFGILGSA